MPTGSGAATRDRRSSGPRAPAPEAGWVESARSVVADTLAGRSEFAEPGLAADLLDGVVADLELLRDRRGAVGFSRAEDAPVRLRLLELLRAELVALWNATDPPPESAEMLEILAALEELRVAAEPGGRHRTVLDLGDPSSLGLVVEMAHDLRSPLTSIVFLAEVLKSGRSGPVTELQARQLGVIYSAAFSLTAVADDLIDVSRRGERLGREEPVAFSLAELVDGVVGMLRPLAETKGVEIRSSTPPQDRRVGRGAALGRVLVNLVTNAVKFTEDGFVEVKAEADGYERVRFSVRDSGRGIPPEARATLFDTFRKSRQRRGFYFSGAGLGLSIARRMVEEMGGQLDFESHVDRGTVFHFTVGLPLPSL